MNIYEKLQTMRVDLQKMNIKKTGKNAFAKYEYYELSDILPPINNIMQANKVCSYITYNSEQAILTLVNSENPEETITFTSPMAEASLKGTHPIQNLGAVETYQRRYLYMTAFEIVENDYFDATQGATDNSNKNTNSKNKPHTAAKQPQQTAQPLTKESGEAINMSIKYLNETFGTPIKDIRKQIEQHIGKPLNALTNDNVAEVMTFLNSLAVEPY